MVFDRDGKYLMMRGEGSFSHPHGIHVGSDGAVYCTDDGNHTVSKFSPDGKLLMMLGHKDQPSDTGYLKLPDLDASLATIRRVGPPFNRPTGVALSSSGEIYVSDGYGNARIHKFSPDGDLLFSWGEPGTAPGQFRQPHSVRVDQLGRVWVCDRANARIQIFDAEGHFLSQWADVGGNPSDLCFGGRETVYVAVKSGDRPHGVSKFTTRGELVERWGTTESSTALFMNTHAIAVDSRGDIYVGEMRQELAMTDSPARALQKFAKVA